MQFSQLDIQACIASPQLPNNFDVFSQHPPDPHSTPRLRITPTLLTLINYLPYAILLCPSHSDEL